MNKQITRQNAKQGQSANRQTTRQSQKLERRREEQQRREAEQRRAKLRRSISIISIVAVILLAVGLTAYLIAKAHSPTGQNGVVVQETPVNPSYPAIDN